MIDTTRRQSLIRRLAFFCGVLVILVTSFSAYIRLSNVGLSCSDWPQCYGQRLRDSQAGVASATETTTVIVVRVAHRVAAVSVLVLVLTMTLMCFFSRPVLWPQGRQSLLLLGMVVFLAVLGRWSSGARVPAVAMGNLLCGFAMVALCWRMVLRPVQTNNLFHAEIQRRRSLTGFARFALYVALLLLVIQIALGGLMSASYASMSCHGLTQCQTLFSGDWSFLSPWREPVFTVTDFSETGVINPMGAGSRLLHELVAGLNALMLLGLGILLFRRQHRGAGLLLMVLILVQLLLGYGLVSYGLPLLMALAHNIVAVLLLSTLVCLL